MPLARANSISDNAGVRAGSVACLPDPGGKTRLNAVSHKHMARHLTCPRCLSEHISRRLSSGQQPLRTADTSRQIHDSGTSQPRSRCDPGRGRRLRQSHQQLTTASAVRRCLPLLLVRDAAWNITRHGNLRACSGLSQFRARSQSDQRSIEVISIQAKFSATSNKAGQAHKRTIFAKRRPALQTDIADLTYGSPARA